MQVNITNDGIEVTDSIRQYIESKLHQRIKKRISSESAIVHVTLSKEKRIIKIIKITLDDDGHKYNVEAKNKDLYLAIGDLIDRLEKEMDKTKSIRKSKRHDSSEGYNPKESKK